MKFIIILFQLLHFLILLLFTITSTMMIVMEQKLVVHLIQFVKDSIVLMEELHRLIMVC